MDIRFEGKYKSITSFNWSDIPSLAVITGPNGTGKSQLLQLIYNSIVNNDQHEKVSIINKDIDPHEVIFIKSEWQLQNTNPVSLSTVQMQMDEYYNLFVHENHTSPHRLGQAKLYHAFQEVLRKTGKSQNDISQVEFYNYFPEVLLIEQESQLSQKIGELFYNYRLYEIDSVIKKMAEDDIKNEIGEKPWVVLREIIRESKLPFDINDPSNSGVKDSFQLKLTHQILKEEVNFNDLSSGEKVLFSLVFYLYNSQEKRIFPKLMLLDEPDAHLHPSMSQQFMNVVKNVLVDKFGVQVIMTTHSPATVALSKEDYIYTINPTTRVIEKTTKDSALSILTKDIPSFSILYENRRQVFVESDNDVSYYEKIYGYLKELLVPEISLSFISSGDTRTDKHGGKIANCNQVINVTTLLREAGNKFVYGIIDWDLNKKEEENYIKINGKEERYSIENLIFDPLLVSFLLIRLKVGGFINIDNDFKYSNIKKLTQTQLQQIVDHFLDLVKGTLFDDGLKDIVECEYVNGIKLTLPKWYLQYNGHELEDALINIFNELNSIKKKSESLLKLEIIDKIMYDFEDYIPMAFLSTFKDIQTT